MTVKDILSRIEYTVIIDGVEHTDRDITFSDWLQNMMKQSEQASGYAPAKEFDPVARENFQKYIAVAYYAGLLPAKVVETRTNEIGKDGCYIFTVETSGTLEQEDDSDNNQTAAPAKFAGMYELLPVDGQGQKSFYGKAVVETYTDGSATLFSYNTPIIKHALNGVLTRLYQGWSQTTGRHIKAFCGLDKAGFMALPMEEQHKPTGTGGRTLTNAESYAAMIGRRNAG